MVQTQQNRLVQSKKTVLSNIVANISPSATLEIDALANRLIKEGKKVIKLGVGQPDFDTPKNIKEAGKRAIDSGFTKYTASSGIPELKAAIILKHKRENNLVYEPNQIVVSAGAKQALYNIIVALCNPLDEVLIPSPYWVSYEEMVKMAGAVPVFVNCLEKDGFELRADQLKKKLSPKTRIVLLNSPCNPTGAVIPKTELKKIAETIINNSSAYIISDEVYEHFVYDGEFVSTASFSQDIYNRTITINAVSKSYSMTGWRIGWSCGPELIMKGIDAFQSHATSNSCSISQMASVEALNGPQESVKVMREAFHKRRDYVVKRLNEIPGFSCVMPKGAFYAFPNVSKLYKKDIKNSSVLSSMLLEKALVAVVPGSAFGADNYIRISYASSMEDLKEGLDRIEKFVKGL